MTFLQKNYIKLDDSKINIDQVIFHWIKSSDENYKSMGNLLGNNENVWALFIGHLVIEKKLRRYSLRLKDNIQHFHMIYYV